MRGFARIGREMDGACEILYSVWLLSQTSLPHLKGFLIFSFKQSHKGGI